MYEGNGHAALSDRGRDALHWAEAHVAARKDARNARLEKVGIAVERPAPGCAHVGTSEHVTAAVERDLGRKPRRLRVGADEDEQSA